MVDGWQRQRHHIEIGGRVLLQARHDHQRVAEQLVEPRPDFLGDGERPALLDLGDHLQEVGTLDLIDRPFAQGGQHILVEDARKYREGRLPAFLEAEPAMLEPLAIHRLEGVFVGEPDSGALLLAVNARIGAFGQQGARFVAQAAGLAKRHLRVGAERHPLLLARPVVAEVPSPAPCSRDGQGEAIQVREGVCLASCLGLSNGQV